MRPSLPRGRLTKKVEIGVCLVFFFLSLFLLCRCWGTLAACCRRWCSGATATASSAKLLELLLALSDDLMDGLAFQFLGQAFGHVVVALCIDRCQYLLDIRSTWALFAGQRGHEVSCDVLQAHDEQWKYLQEVCKVIMLIH